MTGDDLYEQNNNFIKIMKQEGNDITLKTFEGMEHGFFNYGRHQNEYFHITKLEIEKYLQSMKVI